METVHAPSAWRLMRLSVIGVGLAFAWLILSMAFGLGSSEARAAEGDSSSQGLLGKVTQVLGDTVDTLTGAVDATVQTAVPVVADAVETVVEAAPAPVQQLAAPIVEPVVTTVADTVATAVPTVTAPVRTATATVVDTVAQEVVDPVVEPAVALVERVPVIGGIVAELGLRHALSGLPGTVGGVTNDVLDTVDNAGETIGGTRDDAESPLDEPAIPALSDSGTLVAAFSAADGSDARAARWLSAGGDAMLMPFRTSGAVDPASGTAAVSLGDTSLPASVPPGPDPFSTFLPPGSSGSSAGSGGAASAAWALAAAAPFDAHPAWVRHSGPSDDFAPEAPYFTTDVSPD